MAWNGELHSLSDLTTSQLVILSYGAKKKDVQDCKDIKERSYGAKKKATHDRKDIKEDRIPFLWVNWL